MGTAVSLLMISAGAIMVWAVTATASGFSVHTAGNHPDGGRRCRTRPFGRALVELGRFQRQSPP